MLPEGWRIHLLGDLAEFKNGLNYTRSSEGEAIKVVGVGDFKDRSHLEDTRGIQVVTLKGRVSNAELLKSGDLLFVRSNGNRELIGRCLYFPEVSERISFSGFTIRARVDRSQLDPHFASYLLRSKMATEQMFLGGSGTNISNLSQESLTRIEVPIPPLREQLRIVQTLAAWDAAIATAERLLANGWQLRQAMLGKLLQMPVLSLPVEQRERTGSMPPSVQPGVPQLPATPEGWRRIKLGKHLREVARPVALQPDQHYDLVTVKRSRGGVVLRDKLLGDEIRTPSQFQVKAGDFLISKRQIVHGACGIVPPELDGAIVSNEYAVLNCDGGIDLDFLRYLSESIYFQQACFHSSIGVHVEKMIFKTERWLAFPFNIPPLDVQCDIVHALDAASAAIECCAMQVQSLRQEKSALMQQLLTGKRRVRLPAPTEAASA